LVYDNSNGVEFDHFGKHIYLVEYELAKFKYSHIALDKEQKEAVEEFKKEWVEWENNWKCKM
jgi:hypothetical protein